MKYKVGDKVKIKSLDWYNENKDRYGYVNCNGISFTDSMKEHCGKVVTISKVISVGYYLKEDDVKFCWTDEMIEGLVEEKFITTDGLQLNQSNISLEKEMEWNLPQGYQFKDENGNVINATKIVLEKKHNGKLKLESIKKVREYWSEYTRIFIEIYDDEPNECVLTHLYTLECQRKKGYGKQALSEAESIAKELGCHTACLKVETDSWMHNWYLRCGYQWYKNADKGYTWLTKNL